MTTTGELVTNTLFDVKGFVAVVTGGGTGIGLMAAQGLAANGARVYIVGRRKEALDQAIKKYSGSVSGELRGIQADITNPKDVENLAKELESKEPKGVNILVNNAGVTLETEQKEQASNVDYTNAESVQKFLFGQGRQCWEQTLSTDLTSQHYVTASLLPALNTGRQHVTGHSSSVINISSISGTTKTHSSGQFAYAAAKAAFTQLTKQLAFTLHPLRIRVNAIEPGLFPSEMTTGDSDESQKSKLEGPGGKFPAARTGQEGDIASAVLYLGSRAGSYVNGEALHVDGGALLRSPSSA
ncbi:hypothetical protein AJ79_00453 [Helicocarpus griseus UAMH5409]|uniref:Uncharacterized protein n=1 Tax=Helicocarpus griseus UAMH5409 TaxID=1447875 RepID=A0A2B7YA37_9EURO|nr:hypothetical protein AJ79_00453 [Helicocarpus griseus UAMH5409]